LKITRVVAALALAAIGAACNLAIGADEPERRQAGEPCGIPRDCADGLLCILGTCDAASPIGGPCGAASDCADASAVCDLCVCAACSGAACESFTTCGRNCVDRCGLRQRCLVDADCDPKAALVCDTEHHECVIPDCRVGPGDFACGPPQCADYCSYEECSAQCTATCSANVALGLTCDAAGSRCACGAP
jgi:hypothetical protein